MVVKTRLYKATCSQCGMTFRRKTRKELLSALRKHLWSKHRSWMTARIRAGRKNGEDNRPSVEKLVENIADGKAEEAHTIAKKANDTQWLVISKVVDAVVSRLPIQAKVLWAAVKAGRLIWRKFKK